MSVLGDRGCSVSSGVIWTAWTSCLLLFGLWSITVVRADEFHEALILRPLQDGKTLSHFNFTILASDNAWEGQQNFENTHIYQTSLIPRSLAAIIRAYDVEEVHLSLTQGRWDYSRWQDPIGHAAPSGGELYAWIAEYEDEVASAAKDKWTSLTNTLGGLFCTSLNKIDKKITTSPVQTFSPSNPDSERTAFYHALLPLEHPCTENLTPFLSLLPCRAAAGIAELLNPHKLFDANWQQLTIHVDKLPMTGNLRIQLQVEVVQDPVRMTMAINSQPRRDWTFESLYGRPIRRACPIADSSHIEVDVSKEDSEPGYSLAPSTNDGSVRPIFDVAVAQFPLSLTMRWPVLSPEGYRYPSTYAPANVIANRINAGYGRERATLGIELLNNMDKPVEVSWLEEWPWWIKVYLHTLQVEVNGAITDRDEVIRTLKYIPAQTRGRPSVIESTLVLAAHSRTRIVLNADRAYLWYSEYPPDAERGFDVPSGTILVRSSDGTGQGRRIYTTSTLLDMPTPDFSMPYNVIIMTSTVIALFFGSVFNLLTRNWLIVDLRDTPTENADEKSEETKKIIARTAPSKD